jgi:hypothetical protein
MRRRPLLGREIEGRLAMRDRDDDAAPRKYVRRVARIPRGGVQAEGVLKTHVSRMELGQIAEGAVVLGHGCIFMTLAPPCARGTFANSGPAGLVVASGDSRINGAFGR